MEISHQSQTAGNVWMCSPERGLPERERMLGSGKGLGIPARVLELHRLVKGSLCLHQSRIRLLLAGARSCRTAEDHPIIHPKA